MAVPIPGRAPHRPGWLASAGWSGVEGGEGEREKLCSNKSNGESSTSWSQYQSIVSNHSCSTHTKLSVRFQPQNCWGLCWGIGVGPPLCTLLQPKMPTMVAKAAGVISPEGPRAEGLLGFFTILHQHQCNIVCNTQDYVHELTGHGTTLH